MEPKNHFENSTMQKPKEFFENSTMLWSLRENGEVNLGGGTDLAQVNLRADLNLGGKGWNGI